MTDESKKRFWIDWHTLERIQAIFDLAVVIFTGGLWWTSCQQWQAMKDQKVVMQGQLDQMKGGSAQTDRLIEKADSIAHSMTTAIQQNQIAIDKASKANQDAIATSDAQNRRMVDNSIAQSKDSLKAAAEQSRDTLSASVKASQLDQRPWVTVLRFELPRDLDVKTEIAVAFWIQNTGKSPALDEIANVGLMLWPTGKAPTEFTESPSPVIGSSSIVPPGTTNLRSTSLSWIPPEDLVALYRDKKFSLYFRGVLRYRDTFETSHWTTVCAFHTYGMPLNEFQFCRSGNDMDRNSQADDEPHDPTRANWSRNPSVILPAPERKKK